MALILELLALLALFCVLKLIASRNMKRGTKPIGVPEPSGALPIIGHLHLLGDGQNPVALTLGAIADKHGSFFSLRLGHKRLLVVSSWEMAKEFLSTSDRIFATRPRITAGKYIGYNNAIFSLAPHGQYWRDMRKMAVLELLSTRPIETHKHVRASEVESLIKDLYSLSRNNKVVTISQLFEHMAFNIILRLLVGKRFSSSEYGEKTKSKISEGETDFMDAMLSTLSEDAVISGHTRDNIIKATTMILILTGAGSTSVALTWAISLLLNNPSVLKAAQKELDIQVGKDKWVQESDIKNLNYLQAIVKETMRIYPPGPVTGLREAMEDCTIGGYHVSKGTQLIINIWKLQRDPRKVMPRITFGLQVVHLALARVLQGFDIATVGGRKVDMREGLGIALPKADPLEVVLKPRLPMELYNQLL
ncbi:Cytochrome P450 82G1 [Morella rubra]|uniref:Cytochrome P450 82G1 n=1 Tax=Morella rubra TaxID=262757 RepID=A0A6A1V5W2_9ROSI|nr:Cytochrome P450 82G1 [Morella rubra]